MFLMIALLASSPIVSPRPNAVSRGRATVVIIRGQTISARSWDPANNAAQRQIVRKETDGRLTVLRITEFE